MLEDLFTSLLRLLLMQLLPQLPMYMLLLSVQGCAGSASILFDPELTKMTGSTAAHIRSTRQKFYSWYFGSLPYLLWKTPYPTIVRLLLLQRWRSAGIFSPDCSRTFLRLTRIFIGTQLINFHFKCHGSSFRSWESISFKTLVFGRYKLCSSTYGSDYYLLRYKQVQWSLGDTIMFQGGLPRHMKIAQLGILQLNLIL